MIGKILIIIALLLFFNCFNAIAFLRYLKALSNLNIIKTSEVKDIDKLDYRGPDIEIACIHKEGMSDYAKLVTDGKNISLLIPKLQNAKDLILYFDNILGDRAENEGVEWNFRNEWFRISQKNICIISYGFGKIQGKISAKYLDLVPKVKEMVNTHRIEFVAKIARDFVIGIGLELSRVEMLGFCFGAHVGSHACRYCNAAKEKEGKKEKVKKFIGFDPSGISYYLKPERYPQTSDADYVQLVHSNFKTKPNIFPFKLFKLGTSRMTGDVDILAKGLSKSDEHMTASYIFVATAIKKAVLVASRVPSAPRRHEYYSTTQERVTLRECDVFIGIHDEKDDKKLCVFEITLKRLNRVNSYLTQSMIFKMMKMKMKI